MNLRKSILLQQGIEYLGFNIENGCMEINEDRVQAIMPISRKTKMGLFRLLGKLQFVNKYIPRYQEVLAPLAL